MQFIKPSLVSLLVNQSSAHHYCERCPHVILMHKNYGYPYESCNVVMVGMMVMEAVAEVSVANKVELMSTETR